jgi:hypothetical protein
MKAHLLSLIQNNNFKIIKEITYINVSIIQVQDMVVAVDRKFLLDVTKEKHKV